MAVTAKSFEDKQFVLNYLSEATDGNDLQRRLNADNITGVNLLDLVVRMGGWLREDSSDSKTAKAQEAKAAEQARTNDLKSLPSSELTNESKEVVSASDEAANNEANKEETKQKTMTEDSKDKQSSASSTFHKTS